METTTVHHCTSVGQELNSIILSTVLTGHNMPTAVVAILNLEIVIFISCVGGRFDSTFAARASMVGRMV
jgi:hypothetical protein